MSRVEISPHGEEVRAFPLDRLGDAWDAYIAAVNAAGGRSRLERHTTRWYQHLPRHKALKAIAAMQEAGLEVIVTDPALAQEVEAQRDRLRQNATRAQARAELAAEALAQEGLRLRPYQRIGSEWLASRQAALLADQMGLGKTVQALVAIPENSAAVVVCPASVKGVWAKECRRFRTDLRPTILAGRGSFRWPAQGELVIVNPDILPEAFTTATATGPPQGIAIIADEAHAYKTPKAQRTARFRGMAKAVQERGGHAWLLTGTPLLNKPPELWAVLEAAGLAREAFGSWGRFVRLFNGTRGRFGYEWGQPEPEVADCLRRVMLARRRAEVLPELPTKSHRTVTVEIDKATRKACDDLLARLAEQGIDFEEAVQSAIEHQDHAPGFEEISAIRARLAIAKIPGLEDLIDQYEAAEEPVVVFSRHRAAIDALVSRPGWTTITGSVDNDARTERVAQFQAGSLKGLAGTIQAAGVGITLTRAAHVIFLDLDWTPALNEQAEDRCCRLGQTRGVQITRLEADHIVDRRVIELLAEKQEIIRMSTEAAAVRGAGTADRSREAAAAISLDTPRSDEYKSAPQEPRNAKKEENRMRPATTETEAWAAAGLVFVQAMDQDHAKEENGVGFSKYDNAFGHSLADRLKSTGRLSEKQWQAAIKLANKYRRQIGPKPEEKQ